MPSQKQPLKYRGTKRSDLKPSNATVDPRFANFQTDPRYRLPSKRHAKVQLDSRFSRMLDDEDFHRRARVDRYGRRVKGDKGREDLQRLYRAEEKSPEGDETDGSIDESGEDDEVVERELKKASKLQKALNNGYDPARDGGFSSSSESDSSDEEEEHVEEEVEEAEAFGLQGQAAVPMGEVTRRIAVVNLDWDNVRAIDLLAVASSFSPPEGRIESVAVYPSEFGRERMEREELEGPPSAIFSAGANMASDEPTAKRASDGPAEGFDSTALRRYQLDRLRYYYAVIDCSSVEVAQTLYENMDGREYLSSANFFDLRFIPDHVSFETDKPRDVGERVPHGYRPNEFVTDALQHSKVRLTWDEDDRDRKDIQKRAFGRAGMDVEENDMLAYIASASSDDGSEADEDDEDEENEGGVSIAGASRFGLNTANLSKETQKPTDDKAKRAASLRAALGLSGDDGSKVRRSKADAAPVGNLQITFSTGLSEKKNGSVFENAPEETTREKYVRKEKERKARRKMKGKPSAGDDTGVSTENGDSNTITTAAEDGFDDPFFENPEEANRDTLKKARKEEKARLRRERKADEDAQASQRAELELIMADEHASNGGRSMRHFDMNDIAKEEKQQRRKHKSKKNRDGLEEPAGDNAKSGADTSFTVDVNDARFAKVFESHEYAIDPNDPRFKGTEGMKALLEEGRQRRGKRKDVDEIAADEPKRSKKLKPKTSKGTEDVDGLLRRVKSRNSAV